MNTIGLIAILLIVVLLLDLALLFRLVRNRRGVPSSTAGKLAKEIQREETLDMVEPTDAKMPIVSAVPGLPPPVKYETLHLMGRRVVIPEAFVKKVKDEDRIVCEPLGRFPAVIVADGASNRVDPATQDVIEGSGGHAAEIAVEAAKEHLRECLGTTDLSLQECLGHLGNTYGVAAKKMKEQQVDGATTLLIAFLLEVVSGNGIEGYWLYTFEGDGSIFLVNPNRKVDNHPIRLGLVLPGQKFDTTATLSSSGPAIPPILGCIAYQPGDILYVASDGIAAVDEWLRRDKKEFLANYILDTAGDEPDFMSLYAAMSSHANFRDDTVLGIIWTSS